MPPLNEGVAAEVAHEPELVIALEVLLGLAVVVALVVTLAQRLQLPYPILLVVAGLAIGLAPGLPQVELDPELVLVVLLPPILFAAAWSTPIRDVRRDRRPIALLSVGLVLFTTLAVGLVTSVAVPGLPLAAAMALGAIVAPPDAIAATAVLRRLSVPRRIVTILEGESLVNDATALTAYRVAVVAVTTGVFVLADAVLQFGWALTGGVLVGLAVGVGVSWIWARLFDPPVEMLLSLLIPYVAFLVAEEVLGASGVIATVVAGLIVGYRSPRILASEARVAGGFVWQMVTFLMNGFAFLLVGLQLPVILERLSGRSPGELAALALVVCLTVIVTRFLWVFPATYLPRWLSRSIRENDPAPPVGAVVVVSWAGMRGAVSLAAALSLPLGFPERDLLLFLTFSVIIATLIGQGLTLPVLLNRLDLGEDGEERREIVVARTAATDAALRALEDALLRWPGHRPLLENLAGRFRHRAEHLDEVDEDTDQFRERIEHVEIMRAVLASQRDAVIRLRDRGTINDEVLRTVERELDLEELRLEAEA